MTDQTLLPVEFIKIKRDGGRLTASQIQHFVADYTSGKIPDYQMSAWLMAVVCRGLDTEETLALTESMLHSGSVVDLSGLKGFKVDKHSTGGVGDKTSLVLGPIVAACGLPVPMISGRGLGHTGGTLDKLESIPGFNTQLDLIQFRQMLQKIGISFIGQTQEICPADKKMYSLRDVTATVESLPLICASIMSKKLAEGIDGLVLDVKYGNGAFMKTVAQAEALAQSLVNIGKGHGRKVSALITFMGQPLGRFAGNALEVQECLDVMNPDQKNLDRFSQETRELSLQLAARMLKMGFGLSISEAYIKAADSLSSGAALRKFNELCASHGGQLSSLPRPKPWFQVAAKKTGFVVGLQTENIGMIGIRLGAGRTQVSDPIDPVAGFEFHAKIGDQVSAGDPLFTVFGSEGSQRKRAEIEALLQETVSLSDRQAPAPQLIEKEIL
jgi:pyrimidine-nucleoside phosphorylase